MPEEEEEFSHLSVIHQDNSGAEQLLPVVNSVEMGAVYSPPLPACKCTV